MFFRHILLFAILLCTLLHANATPTLGLSVSRCLVRHCFSPRIPVALQKSTEAIREFHRQVTAPFRSPLITTPGERSGKPEKSRSPIAQRVRDGSLMALHFPGEVSGGAYLI